MTFFTNGSPVVRFGFDLRLGILLLLLLLLSACAPSLEERKRFFWPPLIEEPKIEYINFYQTREDVKRGTENRLAEAVFGKEVPRQLFIRPNNIASDGKGRFFVSDIELRKVIVFDLAQKQVRALRGKKGDQWRFAFSSGLAVDDSGGVFVTDSYSHTVYRFGANEVYRTEFGAENLSRPTGLAVDDDRQRVYVVDTGAHRLAVFDTGGNFLGTFGERGSGPGQFNFPLDVDLDGEGNLYVLDSMNARVQVLDPEGRFLRGFGERGTERGSFQVAKGIAVSPSGHVYVTDSRSSRFLIFDKEGDFLLSVGGRFAYVGEEIEPGGFYMPTGIDVDETEAIWIVDSLNRMAHQFQYLNEAYLSEHPILPGQAFIPRGLKRGDGKRGDGKGVD